MIFQLLKILAAVNLYSVYLRLEPFTQLMFLSYLVIFEAFAFSGPSFIF